MDGDDLSIIVPAYKEEDMIVETVNRIRVVYPRAEIIVVDDGSPDKTAEMARSANATIVYVQPKNMGKGAAFRKGIELSTRDIIVQIDADCQFLPEEIYRLVAPIRNGEADVTLGSRFMKNGWCEPGSVSPRNKLGNYIDSLITSIACMKRFTDVQAGFKGFKTAKLKMIDFRQDNFSYEPEIVILAVKQKLRVLDVPISYKKRIKGNSNINFLKDAYRITKTVILTSLR
jgi:glycosyltransferase involved in cell wall biosynthesis